MGNAKSLSRADIEQAAVTANWDEESELLAVLQNAQSKKNKRVSKAARHERKMETSDIDEIYNLVLSLKQEGGEGQELLEKFVARQANLSIKSSMIKPPMKTIVVSMDQSARSSSRKTRARAA